MPPNEKRGRVHSSTITVAVLDEPTEHEVYLDPRDLDISYCRGSGAGGQHRNVTDSAVVIRHIPTGVTVRSEGERSQHANKAAAFAVLRARLRQAERSRKAAEREQDRKVQVGSGERGDKRRTIAVQRGTVEDHETGRTWRYKDYERGLGWPE